MVRLMAMSAPLSNRIESNRVISSLCPRGQTTAPDIPNKTELPSTQNSANDSSSEPAPSLQPLGSTHPRVHRRVATRTFAKSHEGLSARPFPHSAPSRFRFPPAALGALDFGSASLRTSARTRRRRADAVERVCGWRLWQR